MLTEDEKQQALKYASTGALFMFIPSVDLCDKIARGVPETLKLGKYMKRELLARRAICITTKMVVDYCHGVIDDRNKWILDQGDIKVVPDKIVI